MPQSLMVLHDGGLRDVTWQLFGPTTRTQTDLTLRYPSPPTVQPAYFATEMATLEQVRQAFAGSYAVEREVGQGGMATVYLARDLKHARQVALKVLRPELASAMGGDRFPREIQIVAQLAHPHILPLHDSGEIGGFLFYVMPFVEGESLRQKLDARRAACPLREAVRILREVADALAYAHERGIVHRDIKPDNVMLSGRHAVVTDFGVAKAVSAAASTDTLTTVGVALGTPCVHVARAGDGRDVDLDHRSDIYALGAMAYEMLTGEPPFGRPTAQAILSAHVLDAPPDLNTRRADCSAGAHRIRAAMPGEGKDGSMADPPRSCCRCSRTSSRRAVD